MKNILLRIRLFLSFLLIFTISGIFVAYAWFSLVWDSGQSVFGFSVGTVPPPEATMWLYSTEFDENGNSQNVGWKEIDMTQNESDPYAFAIPEISFEENDGIYTFEMKSLQLGTVDNLVIMNLDNIVYLRFAFDSSVHGNGMARIDTELSNSLGELIQIYDSNGLKVTDASLKEDLLEICEETSFLQYQGCISSEKLSPDVSDFNNLEFSDAAFFGDSIDLYENGQQRVEGKYYVYLKIMPNLSAFAPASELLNQYMPCTVLFDTQIQLTVY